MPNSEDQAQKTRPTEAAEADRPVVATAAQLKPYEVGGKLHEVGGKLHEVGGKPHEVGGKPHEVGGRDGPEPTRFGDWELRGRCIDF
jgi:hypothetical protein